MRVTRRILTTSEALARAAALCDKCEQCSPDILKKLSTWGIPSTEADKIIARLKETRYLDDLRFARAYAHDKMAYSGWGRNKIVQGLLVKRLSREYIDQAFDNIDPDEYKRAAIKVVKSKVRSLNGSLSSYENRVKVLRFGVQRGFSISLVTAIINKLATRETNEESAQ